MRELVNINDRGPLWSALNDLDNIFDGFLNTRKTLQNAEAGTIVPAIDVSENENEYRIKAEIPGIRKEDLNVSVQDGILSISAESKSEDEEKVDGRVIRRERRFGKFARSMRLAKDVDTAAVKAEYKDGVLELTLPKVEEVKPKKVAITIN